MQLRSLLLRERGNLNLCADGNTMRSRFRWIYVFAYSNYSCCLLPGDIEIVVDERRSGVTERVQSEN